MADHGTADAPGEAPDPAILVVDDNAAKRLAVRAMLAPLGHTIVEVDSGRAALRAVTRQTFALILMDVRMPTLDGYETAKLIRERSQTRLTPIIFVTASVEEHRGDSDRVCQRRRRLHLHAGHPDVLRAKVSTFVDLFVQSQELQRSLESITALNAALRDSEVRAQAVLAQRRRRDRDGRRGRPDRIVQPIGAPAVRLHARTR